VEPDTLEFIFPDRQPAEILLSDETRQGIPAAATAVHAVPVVAEATEIATAPVVVASAETTMVAEASHDLGLDVDDALLAGDENDHELGSDLLAEPSEDDDDPTLGDFNEEDAVATVPEPGRRLRVEGTMKIPPAGFGTIIRAMGAAVAGFAALAMVVRVAPERTAAWLARLPLAGAGFSHDRNLASKVELRNVQGRFQRLRNARRVFVISGDARNNSPMTIERIEVAGALYGVGGELDQKVVTTGNRTTLTDLSDAEIVLLQRLDPAIALAPGETTPFLIVFLEPPRELREFSSRVLTVRPTRRASTPPLRPAASSRDSVG
jgi:hypothetical protein